MSKKIVPINTWVPWKHVPKKKIDANDLSLMLNILVIYSKIWRIVKVIPNIIVKIKLSKRGLIFLLKILWWAQVIVTPDDKRIMVFKSGIS